MIARISLLALLSAAAMSAGCKTTDSDGLLTSGMYAQISATADGTGNTTLGATLFLGPPSDLIFVHLDGGDQLIAHHGSESKVMSEQNILGIITHAAMFASDGANDTFEVELRRQVDAGAPSSKITLPAPFTLGTVPASISRAAAFGVDWTGSSTDRMRWTAEGSCIQTASGTISSAGSGDAGSVTMPAGTFKKAAGQNVPDTCQVKVTILRERDGQIDRAFEEGGTATGVQTRSVTFTSTL